MGVSEALAIKGRAMARIYVSSTFVDLREYRAKLIETLRQLGHKVIAMEDYVAEHQIPLEKCLEDVSSCEMYVGVFGWRYGYIPPDDPVNLSITEREYRRAEQEEMPRLVFILEASEPWPPHYIDAFTGDGKKGERIKSFREELKQKRLVSFFTSPDDLARTVSVSVSLHTVKALLQPLKRSAESVASAQGIPPSGSSDMVALGSSYIKPIVEAIMGLVREAKDARVLVIDLLREDYWWSTRLFLVAALTAKYTSVGCLAFVTEGDCFFGLASPWATLIALSKAFPEMANAYYSTPPHPDPSASDTDEIVHQVQSFSYALGALEGGEEENKVNVSTRLLEQWLGKELAKDSVQADLTELKLLYAYQPSNRRLPYVALVREGKLVNVVDRAALAIDVVRGYIKVTRAS
jgi:hypothetical protein